MSHYRFGRLGTVVKVALTTIDAMPPLAARKNPYVAFGAGLFGAVGNGLYLRTWTDTGASFALNMGFTIALPGVGLLPSVLFSAAYGAQRVRSSNAKLDAITGA